MSKSLNLFPSDHPDNKRPAATIRHDCFSGMHVSLHHSIYCGTTRCNRRTVRGPLRGVQVLRSLDQLLRFLTTSVVGAHVAGMRNLLCARVRIPRWSVGFVCTRTLACRASRGMHVGQSPPCSPARSQRTSLPACRTAHSIVPSIPMPCAGGWLVGAHKCGSYLVRTRWRNALPRAS